MALRSRLDTLDEPVLGKMDVLEAALHRFRRVMIGFSGGVDSTFLAWASREVLGSANVALVTADSPTYPRFELQEAVELAGSLGLAHRIIHTDEMDNAEYRQNPPNRCYHCKHELFCRIREIAGSEGFDGIFEGGNASDLGDYRPGRTAIAELRVVSPLAEAGLTKDEIRAASALAGLPTSSKPSYACLASRFPYGETITPEKLRRVEQAEESLRSLGFTQFRVRSHADLARVEFVSGEIDRAWTQRREIAEACRKAGFIYSAIDMAGYRTGAMNEGLPGMQN